MTLISPINIWLHVQDIVEAHPATLRGSYEMKKSDSRRRTCAAFTAKLAHYQVVTGSHCSIHG